MTHDDFYDHNFPDAEADIDEEHGEQGAAYLEGLRTRSGEQGYETFWAHVDRGSGASLVDESVLPKVLLVQPPLRTKDRVAFHAFMRREFELYGEFQTLGPEGPVMAWAMYLDRFSEAVQDRSGRPQETRPPDQLQRVDSGVARALMSFECSVSRSRSASVPSDGRRTNLGST